MIRDGLGLGALPWILPLAQSGERIALANKIAVQVSVPRRPDLSAQLFAPPE